MARIYIHIGMGKTGTSAIQRMLRTNMKTLEQNGYFYAGLTFENLGVSYKTSEDLIRTLRKMNKEEKGRYLSEMFKKCFNYCTRHQISRIIWSWEGLGMNPHGIAPAIFHATRGHAVKIIIYLRRQDHWLESAYQQWGVKYRPQHKENNGFDDYCRQAKENGKLDYLKRISLWSDIFGDESVIVRVYEKEQLKEGLFVDFLKAIDFENIAEIMQPTLPVYQSFNPDVVEVLKIYSESTQNPKEVGRLTRLFEKSLNSSEFKGPFEPFGKLTPEQRQQLLDEYGAGNRQIAKKFLKRKSGQLFYEEGVADNISIDHDSELSVESLARIFSQVALYLDQNDLRNLIDDNIKLKWAVKLGIAGIFMTICWLIFLSFYCLMH